MKVFLRRVLCLAAALGMVLSAAGAEEVPAESPIVPALELPEAVGGSVVPIPVDRKTKDVTEPYDGAYIFPDGEKNPTGYADPSITVNIGRGRIYDTDYVYARIRLADPSQIRTALASGWGSEKAERGDTICKKYKPVIAINGDYCLRAGIRQGSVKSKNLKGDHDVLIIDDKGDLHVIENARWADVEAFGDSAVNLFTFGPALILNGEPRYGYNERAISTHRPAQRTCICQTGPLEYLVLTSSGPEDANNTGMTIDQLVELLDSFGCIQTAYNLDGGGSSTMIFRLGNRRWEKINATLKRVRDLKDIIYFSTAWEED